MRNRYARCKIFGVDDALLGAGTSFLGGIVNNLMASGRQEDASQQNLFNAMQMGNFNAQQAQVARDWTQNQADITRNFNAQQARETRDWSAAMSNSAYQRTMSDMRSAGLNPILAYRQGQSGTPSAATASASSPSGASASGPGPGGVSPAQTFDIVGPALNTAMAMTRVANETKQTDAQVALLNAQKATEEKRPGYVGAQTDTERRRPGEVEARTGLDMARSRTEQQEAIIRENQAKKAAIEQELWQNGAAKILYQSGLIGQSVDQVRKPVTGTLDSVSDFLGRGRKTTTTTESSKQRGPNFEDIWSRTTRE